MRLKSTGLTATWLTSCGETIGPYFAGDKAMNETIALFQNRVTLYVNESR